MSAANLVDERKWDHGLPQMQIRQQYNVHSTNALIFVSPANQRISDLHDFLVNSPLLQGNPPPPHPAL